MTRLWIGTGCRTVVMQGRPRRGYVYVDAGAVKALDALRYWIDLALQHKAS